MSVNVRFGLDGKQYSANLPPERAEELRAVLAPFIAEADQVSPPPYELPDGIDPAAVRSWAVRNGVEIGSRGPIPPSVIEKYQQFIDS